MEKIVKGSCFPKNETQLSAVRAYLEYHHLDGNDCQAVKHAMDYIREFGRKLCE